ncbi:HEAT repeat domain-containing protein [Actinomadura sp. GTD37]|uniref:HEAT repeat domain-containing protein n=1 Tax=Actinomadura sp. GTD37 TaxID=1778030 RepID=UPI0035BED07E
MTDPLAGLDDVDWAGLDHAYGSAADVPALLRSLRSAGEDEREAALGELFTTIYHQGGRYGASAAAVPFLLALAADPTAPERTWPLYLAVALAIGFEEAHLPSGVEAASWRDEVARLRATDPEAEARRLDAWVAEAESERQRRDRAFDRDGFDLARVRRRATDELAAYDAVRAGLPAVRALLGDRDAGLRVAAAYALGWFPEEAGPSLAALGALLDREADPPVIAHALISAGLLDGRALLPRLRAHLAGAEPLPRWAAAVALARLGAADARVVAELAAGAASPPDAHIAFLDGGPRLYSALALAALDEVPEEAADAVLDGLSRTSGEMSFPVAEAALRLAFRAPVRTLPPFADLTRRQRRTVRTIAGLPADSWRWGNLLEILGVWGLPAGHDECRRYAGIA